MSEAPIINPEPRQVSPWMMIGGIALLAAVGAIGLAILATVLAPEPNPVPSGVAQAQLADGSVLVLHGITDSTTFELPDVAAGNWEQFIERLFGNGRSRVKFHASSTGNNSLTLWLARYDGQTGAPLEFDRWSHSIIRTSHGIEHPDHRHGWRMTRQTHPHQSTSTSSSSRPFSTLKPGTYSHILYASKISRLRSSDGQLEIDIYHADDGHVATLSAPLTGIVSRFPVWTPKPLPITKSDGDLTVTLTSIASRLRQVASMQNQPPYQHIDVGLNIEQHGEPTQLWSDRHVSLADALGNTSGTYDCTLAPGEAAWRVRVQLFRSEEAALLQGPLPADGPGGTPGSPVSADRWLIVEDIPLPDDDPTTTPNSTLSGRTATINGVSMTLMGVGGPGESEYSFKTARSGRSSYSGQDGIRTEFRPPNATLSIDNTRRHIAFTTTGVTPAHRVVLMLTDQNGVRIPTDRGHRTFEAHVWLFEPDEWVTSVNVYVTVQRARNVEFTIPPPQPVAPE